MKEKIIQYLPKAIIAFIFLMPALMFKFPAHETSVAMFEQLNLFGMGEMVGRLGTGIIEVLIAIALFIPKTEKIAAFGAMIIMAGALYFHATVLGFEGENLQMTIMATIALISAIFVWKRKPKQKITVIEA